MTASQAFTRRQPFSASRVHQRRRGHRRLRAGPQPAQGDHEEAWTTVTPLLDACAEPAAADALVFLVNEGAFERARGLDVCARLLAHHARRSSVLVGLGLSSEKLVDPDDLNAARVAPALTDESVRWNLGICATGAGDAAAALQVWRLLGQKIEHGRFRLPEGSYHAVKVRLVQRPLAERSVAEDDPGREETIWIERLSPCHGIVRSALFYDDIAVDYGDVVLFDGAPITHHLTGAGTSVPVFPHLATLVRSGYLIFPFVGTQREAGQLGALSAELPEDAVVYSHTEQMVFLCAECARGGGGGHKHDPGVEHRVVRGKVCAPPQVGARGLLAALDAALAGSDGARIHAPGLCMAAGEPGRAEAERVQVARLTES